MQRPHESTFSSNPAFADLYPRLDSRVQQLLNKDDDEQQRLQLEQLTRLWTKLKILWDELQLVLADERYKDLSKSLSEHVTQGRFQRQYKQDLAALKIPETHTFIQTPSNLEEQLGILSDVLAVALEEKLSVFSKLQALAEHGDDLAAEKKFREAQKKEFESANAVLHRQLSQSIAELYQSATVFVTNQADYIEKIKHGSAEKFTSSYLEYHEIAVKALLDKSQKTLNDLIGTVYTAERRLALEQKARHIKREIPRMQERLQQTNDEIRQKEETKTPQYVAALAEYQRLKGQIAQAEQDIDKLSHYKTGR